MAPGWMTSRRVYRQVIRPAWMSERGDVLRPKFSPHWDYQMDSIIGQRECIFPEVPRLRHMGGGGFSVSSKLQAEMFGNLRLSQLPVGVPYGDVVARLTADGYDRELRRFIQRATPVHAARDVARYRDAKLVLLVDASTEADNAWNEMLSAFFGVYGIGGYTHLFKQRGVHRGTVFVRYLTNLVLVVGRYSPLMPAYAAAHGTLHGPWARARFVGCYRDDRAARDLPWLARFVAPVTVERCVAACRLWGHAYAGVQLAECWCGDAYGRHGAAAAAGECRPCQFEARGADGTVDIAAGPNAQSCGGEWRNAVYRVPPRLLHHELRGAVAALDGSASMPLHTVVGAVEAARLRALPEPPRDHVLVRGEAGESCDAACLRGAPGPGWRCDVGLMPLLAGDCPRLRELMGCTAEPAEHGSGADQCPQAGESGFGNVAPGARGRRCFGARTMFLRCAAVPADRDFRRACLCTERAGRER